VDWQKYLETVWLQRWWLAFSTTETTSHTMTPKSGSFQLHSLLDNSSAMKMATTRLKINEIWSGSSQTPFSSIAVH